MSYNCPECARLWGEYARATVAHVRLEGDLQMASHQQNHRRVREQEPLVERANQRRMAARAAIADHENILHREETMTAKTGA